jgi:hypothetical protein
LADANFAGQLLTQLLKSTFYMNIFKDPNPPQERDAIFSEAILLVVSSPSV